MANWRVTRSSEAWKERSIRPRVWSGFHAVVKVGGLAQSVIPPKGISDCDMRRKRRIVSGAAGWSQVMKKINESIMRTRSTPAAVGSALLCS